MAASGEKAVFALQLDLTRHCIETEIKRRRNRAVSDYFRAIRSPTADLKQSSEQIIALTDKALQGLDFCRLRSTHAPLAGHSRAHVVLVWDGDQLSIRINGQAVDLGA